MGRRTKTNTAYQRHGVLYYLVLILLGLSHFFGQIVMLVRFPQDSADSFQRASQIGMLARFLPENADSTEKTTAEASGNMKELSCSSPEKDAPWILNSCSSSSPQSYGGKPCDICGDSALYLKSLRDKIEAKYKDLCSELVVYGAALGSDYGRWMTERSFFHPNAKQSVDVHGTCMFQFTTSGRSPWTRHGGNDWPDDDVREWQPQLSADGSQILINVDISKMPYKNNRRNVKLLKLNPGLLFPWAKRVIWQDAKLLQGSRFYDIPVDYLGHFNATIERYNVCSSFMGLPRHRNSVGDSSSVDLMSHCKTIIDVASRRPAVSDGLDNLILQCQMYYEAYEGRADEASKVFNQQPLVDSAFMLFDMRSASCRAFISKLLCSWLDEIHCHSDRDQLSFPITLSRSDLHLISSSGDDGLEGGVPRGDRVYADNVHNAPLVHIANPKCHWYNKKFSSCITSTRYGSPRKRKVAVMVAGTLQRFLFKSAIDKLVQPMVEEDFAVDYYLSLTTSKAKAYRSNSSYMSYATTDLDVTNNDTQSVSSSIMELLWNRGANGRVISIQSDIDIDKEELVRARREEAEAEYPDEDTDLRFPMLDLRTSDIQERTADANRNLLKMHRAIQMLWEKAVQWEEDSGEKYDVVIFMRDDSFWLSEFELDLLLEFGPNDDIFLPSCNARNPPLHPMEVCDHIVISKRPSADIFGTYFTKLFKINTQACHDRFMLFQQENSRGCNSEMLLKHVMDEEGVQVRELPQRMIPFQRSVNIKTPTGNRYCFHKFCQSRTSPLRLDNGLGLCKDVDWKEVMSERSPARNIEKQASKEVAGFLRGDQIALAAERRAASSNNQQQRVRGISGAQQYLRPRPTQQYQHQIHWNPRHQLQQFGGGRYGQQQQQQQQQPQQPRQQQQQQQQLRQQQAKSSQQREASESQAFPLTYQHPNMQHNWRLPSVSEDGWNEETERSIRQPGSNGSRGQYGQLGANPYQLPQLRQQEQQRHESPSSLSWHARKSSSSIDRRVGGHRDERDEPDAVAPPSEKSLLLPSTPAGYDEEEVVVPYAV